MLDASNKIYQIARSNAGVSIEKHKNFCHIFGYSILSAGCIGHVRAKHISHIQIGLSDFKWTFIFHFDVQFHITYLNNRMLNAVN